MKGGIRACTTHQDGRHKQLLQDMGFAKDGGPTSAAPVPHCLLQAMVPAAYGVGYAAKRSITSTSNANGRAPARKTP